MKKQRTNRKIKIESIQVFAIADESPDTSYMGEYTDKADDWCIDRASGELCFKIWQRARLIEQLHERLDDHQDETNTPEYAVLLEKTRKRIEKIRNSGAVETTKQNPEYSFFLPSSNHIPHNPKNCDHVQGEQRAAVIKEHGSIKKADLAYAIQDFNRMEALNNGHWYYMGISAEAKILIPSNIPDSAQIQSITSGGLWGTESDSGADYLQEEAKNQLDDLAQQLRAIGIGARAIAYAIKNWNGEIIYK